MNASCDLHTHTTASDGQYTPFGLVKLAKEKGLSSWPSPIMTPYELFPQCCTRFLLGWSVSRKSSERKHGKTTKGNKTLKSILIDCAKSARNVKGSYFSAQYQRISARRGKNRAIVAVAHSMLIAIYHMLKFGVPFRDLGVSADAVL